MAIKKILVSDSIGSTEEVRSSNIGYNDVTNQISASKITAYNLSSSLPSGILQANGNFISGSVITGSGGASGSLLQFSGSRYVFNLPTNIGGDLSGSTTELNNVKVISVANVNSGTLPFAYGGTGLSSALSGVLIKGAGNTVEVLATADTGSVIGLNADGWFIDTTDPTTNYKPRIDLYTTSGTWTKIGNPRFLKVIVVGGGGGGGSGGKAPTIQPAAASGGGGGGFSELVFEASNVSVASITVGAGGSSGSAPTISPTTAAGKSGTSGGNSFFISSTIALTASGGGFGAYQPSNINPFAGGLAGGGNKNLGLSANGGAAPGAGNPGLSGGDGYYTSGGGSGGAYDGLGGKGGDVKYIDIDGPTNVVFASPTTSGNGESANKKLLESGSYRINGSSGLAITPFYIGTGGSGGSGNQIITATIPSGYGGHAGSGSGGGGGAGSGGTPYAGRTAGAGGTGGNGYVIIYSY